MTFKTTLMATATAALLAGPAFADAHSTLTVEDVLGTASGGESAMADDAMAMDNPTVGGAPMLADQPIAVNASNAPNLTTLVAAVTQAELVETLSGEGPFTVFAPVNDAFAALPEATVNSLMMDENRAALQGILTYHVVPGTITAADLMEAIENNEYANFTTVEGGTITADLVNGNVVIFDETGRFSTVTTADVMQSNGVVHVIDRVLMPAS
ncbi:fasciclin domain-containing protein [Rhodobacterales bacterium HKCCE4037]|nr:fasciclin domain-containing protein [Rhodobacterales bacterium HKCCE4037]